LSGHTNDSDARLLAEIASGERSALACLYDQYGRLLFALAMRMLSHPSDAEDLLHDVFVEVWQTAGDYDPTRASVRSWLVVKTRSRALDRLRSAGRRRAAPLEEARLEETASSSDPSKGSDRTRIRKAVRALPPRLREVIVLAYFEGLSSTEIAARVDIPVGTVKSRVAAARRALRELIEPSTESDS